MFKRIGLYIFTNLAVIVLLNIVLLIIERYLGIQLTGYWYYLVLAVIIWFGWSFLSLYLSKWMAKKAYKLSIITSDNVSSLNKKQKLVWDVVSELAARNNIDMPEVWIYWDVDANAFATWSSKNSALVAVSTGLLELMDEDAIEWVIAHEMAHVLNWDMVTMALLQWILNTFVIFISRVIANIISNFLDDNISWFAQLAIIIVLEIMFWLLASIVLMAFSRHREFRADEWSAHFVWKAKMIAWLKALQKMQDSLHNPIDRKFASMQISSRKKTWLSSVFSSHPSLDDRIKRLENLSI